MIIFKEGDMSSTDILWKVKAGPELTDLGGSRIRRTRKGDLMLGLNKSSEKTADSFHDQAKRVLAEQAEMKAQREEIAMEFKDLDEVISREDICVEQFNLGRIQKKIDRYYWLAGETRS